MILCCALVAEIVPGPETLVLPCDDCQRDVIVSHTVEQVITYADVLCLDCASTKIHNEKRKPLVVEAAP